MPRGAKCWCFTLNNPESEWPINFTEWDSVSYAVHQLECGASGTRHWQGYVEFAKKQSLSYLRRILPRAHWEVRRGSRDEARTYCMKEEGRQAGPYEHGTWQRSLQGKRSDLLVVKEKIKQGVNEAEIADEHFQSWVRFYKAFREYRRITVPNRNWKTEVHVLHGPTGTGKSKWAMDHYPNAYWKQRSQWWDGYEGQDCVVLDEFYGWLPYDVLLRLCDRYPLLVETKGGQVNFLAKTLIITTNEHPEKWYKNCYWQALQRRVDIWHNLPMLGTHVEFTDYVGFFLTIN